MEGQVSDALRELCEITLKSYMDVAGQGAGTFTYGVLGVFSSIGTNLYYATAREGAPGIPQVEEALAKLTLEAYVRPH